MDRILLVDDDVDFLGLLDLLLKDSFTVDKATSTLEAAELIKMYEYKAVVLDVSLPDFTGYYLGELVRKANPKTPIAFLTNYDGPITRENAEEISAEFWKKTDIIESPKTLVDKIKSLYDKID